MAAPLTVLIRLTRQSALPLALAVGYAWWDFTSLPESGRTAATFVKSCGVSFFLIMWFVGLWFRADKQLTDSEQLSGIKTDVKKLKTVTDLIIYCLAHPDAKVTPKYGEDGGVCGLYVDMQANVTGSGSIGASASTDKAA